ncbi:MAG: hypothetical protein WDO68_01705 [Gammaproteobacteria bacterium]
MIRPSSSRIASTAAFVLGMALLAPAVSMSANAQRPDVAPAATNGDVAWKADGNRGVWIQREGERRYYARFSAPCKGLPEAADVRVNPDADGLLSGGSSITVGSAERCAFSDLRLDEEPAQAANAVPAHGHAPLAWQLEPSELKDLVSAASSELGADDAIDVEQSDGSVVPGIVVRSDAAEPDEARTRVEAPCGLASTVWAFAHPASAWRILAPIPPTTNTGACFIAASGGADPWAASGLPQS